MRKKKLKRGLKDETKKRREVAENNKLFLKKKRIEDNTGHTKNELVYNSLLIHL